MSYFNPKIRVNLTPISELNLELKVLQKRSYFGPKFLTPFLELKQPLKIYCVGHGFYVSLKLYYRSRCLLP